MRPVFTLRRALGNLARGWVSALLTTAVIAVCLFLAGLYLQMALAGAQVLEGWRSELRVTFFLRPQASDQAVAALSARLSASPAVESVTLVTREQAREEFRSMVGDEGLAGQEDLALPPSLRVTLRPASRTTRGVEEALAAAGSDPAVEEARYGKEGLVRIESAARLLGAAGGLVGALLLLAAVFVIAVTLRLAIISRREELETLRFVGATETFIRAPFLLEGSLQGLAGGGAALGALLLLHRAAAERLGDLVPLLFGLEAIPFLPPPAAAGLVAAGVVLGGAGSLLALSRLPRP